jgi:hypothetical protein
VSWIAVRNDVRKTVLAWTKWWTVETSGEYRSRWNTWSTLDSVLFLIGLSNNFVAISSIKKFTAEALRRGEMKTDSVDYDTLVIWFRCKSDDFKSVDRHFRRNWFCPAIVVIDIIAVNSTLIEGFDIKFTEEPSIE